MNSLVKILTMASISSVSILLHETAFAGNHKNNIVARSPCLPNKTGHCGTGHTQPTCKGPHKGPNGVMIQCD